MTAEQAVAQLQSTQQVQPAPSASGISGYIEQGLNAALQYGLTHNKDIQAMINGLLQKSGVLSADEEKQVVDAVAEEKKRQAEAKVNRTKTTVLIAGIGLVAIIGTTIYLIAKKKKQ
jgi:hypothetical protein